jgi:hypothetical protein
MLCLLTLPFHFLAAILFLPFLVLRIVFKVIAAIVFLPILFLIACIGIVIGGIALFFAVVVPLVPILLLVLLVALVVRLATRRPAATA